MVTTLLEILIRRKYLANHSLIITKYQSLCGCLSTKPEGSRIIIAGIQLIMPMWKIIYLQNPYLYII